MSQKIINDFNNVIKPLKNENGGMRLEGAKNEQIVFKSGLNEIQKEGLNQTSKKWNTKY